ncbi:YitT family protein [Paenibacillus sp. D2_2]|uniref:YitT family protein n=1 Tax=Paenibacillus sp. D2_2 TaxID=3073092 RepID=UPI002816307E|nr:YitT family protein [Paenibacillus sp. D2_2]WMT40287.1 YitT family protein [Paenibacillus sp. D2_2]
MNSKFTLFSPVKRQLHSKVPDSKLSKVLGVIAGALLASIGLELFLMPHGIIVGGMTGLSALLAFYTELRLGLFLFLLNLPLIMLQRWKIGGFTSLSILGLLVLSLGSFMLHPFPALTSNPVPAALVGGLSLGFGVGLAIRFGGALDASEKLFDWLRSKWSLSTDALIWLFNCLIFVSAIWLIGFEQATHSVIAYIFVFESVKLSLRGIRIHVSVMISSRKSEEIRQEIAFYLNRDSSYEEASSSQNALLHCKCHRWELSRLKSVVKNCDPHSEITIKS